MYLLLKLKTTIICNKSYDISVDELILEGEHWDLQNVTFWKATYCCKVAQFNATAGLEYAYRAKVYMCKALVQLIACCDFKCYWCIAMKISQCIYTF